jgi:RimJ/RimL family protein N-acetyltransferase
MDATAGGRPGMMPGVTVKLRLLKGEPEEMAELQRVLEGAPTYAERVTGYPPGAADAQSAFTILPEGVDHADKFVWGLITDEGMVGCIDVIRGWPSADTAHVGLFLIDEAHTRQGLGQAAFEALEAEVREWPGITSLRAAVVATNAEVLPFWQRMGFAETGEVKPYRHDQLVSESIILAKKL